MRSDNNICMYCTHWARDKSKDYDYPVELADGYCPVLKHFTFYDSDACESFKSFEEDDDKCL